MDSFHLMFEKWSKRKHSKPSFHLKNLPLDYWSNQTFKVIGDHSGGLENIVSETINLLNVYEAKIQVKRSQFGFVKATLEITGFNWGNLFLHFGDYEQIEPPPLTKAHLSFEDFSNPFDLQRLNEALTNEGDVDDSFFSEGVEFLRSIQKIPLYTRNRFEALKHGAHQILASRHRLPPIDNVFKFGLQGKQCEHGWIRRAIFKKERE